MKRLLTVLFVATLALVGVAAPTARADAASQKANATTVAAIVDAHNEIRAANNLPPLKFVPYVATQVSQPWAIAMQRAGKISHNSDFRFAGAQAWGENVAWNVGYTNPVQQMMTGFMDSPGHRANILDPGYDLISVGAVVNGSEVYAAVNFYKGPLTGGGTAFDSGAQWLTALNAGINAVNVTRTDDVYSKDGTYALNNRLWKVACEPYSKTTRCRTEIWGTQVATVRGQYQRVTGWAFNNLTYAPAPRSLWGSNPLVVPGDHTISGRLWRTECNTPVTGGNGCRSYIHTNVVTATARPGGGYTYTVKPDYVFNNIVRYTAG